MATPMPAKKAATRFGSDVGSKGRRHGPNAYRIPVCTMGLSRSSGATACAMESVAVSDSTSDPVQRTKE